MLWGKLGSEKLHQTLPSEILKKSPARRENDHRPSNASGRNHTQWERYWQGMRKAIPHHKIIIDCRVYTMNKELWITYLYDTICV